MSKKVIIVTGASAGIGQACADRLAKAGWTVVGASRRGSSGQSWQGMVMDVDNDESVAQGFAQVLAEHGRIDAVIAGAGWGLAGAAEQTPIADAKAQVETLLWGAVRCAQAALPTFRQQGGGRIVLIGSIGGVIALPYQAFYSVGKFALEGFAEALAYEVEPFGVQVTVIEPGNFKTDFTQSRRTIVPSGDDPYRAARERAIGTMERDEVHGADPADVAKAIERVLDSKKPPRRVTVGKMGERVGVMAKRLLPFRLFEKSARGALGV
jgi:NAD(P)-dependent dehydrogenase (short-subunit alcohol dehydrogenase family)